MKKVTLRGTYDAAVHIEIHKKWVGEYHIKRYGEVIQNEYVAQGEYADRLRSLLDKVHWDVECNDIARSLFEGTALELYDSETDAKAIMNLGDPRRKSVAKWYKTLEALIYEIRSEG